MALNNPSKLFLSFKQINTEPRYITFKRNLALMFVILLLQQGVRFLENSKYFSFGVPAVGRDPLKRYFRLSGVPLKLCRFILGRAIIFLSVRSF